MEKISKNKNHTLVFAEVNKDTFEAIRSGKKKIETRAGSVKYQKVKSGDTLIMSCAGKEFPKKVKKVRHFKSIPALFKVYTPYEINDKTKSVAEATKVYYGYSGYKEKIAKFGLFAFELE